MISVIMPVFNAEKYIKKSIESILSQTESNLELLIIDDCGQDSSMEIVSSINDSRIRVLKNDENRGIAFSRNRGLDEARGEYIALMDDDDIAPLKRLELGKKYLEENVNVDVVGGSVIQIDKNDCRLSEPYQVICNPKRIWAELLFRNVVANGSTMMRSSFIRKHGLRYKDNYLGMEDYKFWTECAAVGNIANMDEVLLFWRNIEGNETHRYMKEKQDARKELFAQIQKENLEMNGFYLNEKDFCIYKQSFNETKRDYITLAELKETHMVLEKLIQQAREKKIPCLSEFEFVCHRMFALKTENSELWRRRTSTCGL